MCNYFTTLLRKHRSVIIYIAFGALTTLVNYLVYYPLYNLAEFSAAVSNGISWLAAVIFAFFTNKLFVFGSKSWSPNIIVPEFVKFVGFRLLSGFMETAILYVAVDLFASNGNVWKVITSVFVIVINYIASKVFVFKNRKSH